MNIIFKNIILLFSASLLILFFGCQGKVQKEQVDPVNQPHINRIENSLYPIYNLRGKEKPKTIAEMMRENHVVGLSMAFVDQGKIAWTQCYGYANLEDSTKMTPHTVLRAASLSKPVTAMAALHLVEEGKLELNQDINQQLKGWKLPDNEYTKDHKVTAAQIIGHRSGIKNDVHEGVRPDQALPSLEAIFSGRSSYTPAEVVYIPGEKYKYSNVGYMVLSELLADVTGKDFPALMNEVIFQPCKMTSSTFKQELSTSFQNRIAVGYNENMQVVPFYKHPSAGAGALWTTPTDLGLFLAEIFSTYHQQNKDGKIISAEMTKKVFQKSNKKLGFNKNISDENFVIRNDGSIPGYNCTLMGSLTKNQAVVIMLNTGSDQAYDFINYLWRAVSMEYNWEFFEPHFYDAVEISAEELAKYEGIYSSQNDSFRVTINQDQLAINSTETGEKQLVPIGNNSFLIPEIPMRLGFETDSTGLVINLYVRGRSGDGRAPYARLP